jgi:hypothetical protein
VLRAQSVDARSIVGRHGFYLAGYVVLHRSLARRANRPEGRQRPDGNTFTLLAMDEACQGDELLG